MEGYPKAEVELQEEILVTFIEGRCVHARLMKYDAYLLWEIHLKILEKLAEPPPAQVKGYGVPCAMKLNGEMYVRAVILNVYPPNMALVELIDIGTKEIVQLNELTMLMEQLGEYPPMAVHILLKEQTMLSQNCRGVLKDVELVTLNGTSHLYARFHRFPDPSIVCYDSVPAYDFTIENCCYVADECKPTRAQVVFESAPEPKEPTELSRREVSESPRAKSHDPSTKDSLEPSREFFELSPMQKGFENMCAPQKSADPSPQAGLRSEATRSVERVVSPTDGSPVPLPACQSFWVPSENGSSTVLPKQTLQSERSFPILPPKPSRATPVEPSEQYICSTPSSPSPPTSAARPSRAPQVGQLAGYAPLQGSSSPRGPSPTADTCPEPSEKLDVPLRHRGFLPEVPSEPSPPNVRLELCNVRLPRKLSAFVPPLEKFQPINRSESRSIRQDPPRPQQPEEVYEIAKDNEQHSGVAEHHHSQNGYRIAYHHENYDIVQSLQRVLPGRQTEPPNPKFVSEFKKPHIPPTFRAGAYGFKVLSKHADGEKYFTVCHAGADLLLNELESRLQAFSDQLRFVDNLAVGDYVLAAFGNDTPFWSRAVVYEVSLDDVQVEYVDYGIYDRIPCSNIRELPAAYAHIPALAAQIMPTVRLEVGKHYLGFIETEIDGFQRLFDAFVPKLFPRTISPLEDGMICSRNTFIIAGRTLFGAQKLVDITDIELQMTSWYGETSRPDAVRQDPKVGSRVVVQCEGVFCRALVTEFDGQGAILYLADYGILKFVPKEEILGLHPEMEQNDWEMRSFLCVLAELEEPRIGGMYTFRIHSEFSVYAGIVIYEASLE